MKRMTAVAALVLCIGLAASGQFHYAFYYDLSGGQDLEINLMNTMPRANDLFIEVHDAYGGVVWDLSGTVAGYATAYTRLSEHIAPDDTHWGVVTVDSSDRLIIGLEYYKDGLLVSIDTIYSPVPEVDPDEPFWLGTYYTQVGDSETAYVLMNPSSKTAACSVTAYDANGAPVHSQEFVLSPYESEYVWLGREIAAGSLSYGLLDIEMQGQVVILALEYTGRGLSELEIDNVTEYYY